MAGYKSPGWGVLIRQEFDEIEQGAREIGSFSLWIGLISVLVIVIAGYWMASSISRPLQSVNEAIGKVAKGDLSVRVDVKSKDEVGQVGVSLNQAVATMKEAREAQEAGQKDSLAYSKVIERL